MRLPAVFCFFLITSTALAASLPRPEHIVLVIEENHSYSDIIGNSSAPYVNALAQQGALFTSSQAITHPSQPNYLALFSGSTQGITDDSCPNTFSAPNLGGSLLNASLSFIGYSEDLPETGSTVCNAGQYYRKHNPWVNFTDVPEASNQPYSNFPTDYSQLPTVAIVVPNQNNDMHDGSIEQGDTWLKSHLEAYVQWAQSHNSLLIVTFDEGEGVEGNRILTLFVGPMVAPGPYSESINHYSVLRTLEDMYGLTPVGESANAAAISDVWLAAADTTNSQTDSDGDGIPDELETALGSNPFNAAETPVGYSAGTPQPLVIERLTIRLNFSGAGTDSIRLSVRLPIPKGFSPANQALHIDVGGALFSFTLGPRGFTSSSQNAVHIVARKVPGQDARLTAELRRGDFVIPLRDEGLTDETLRRVERNVPIYVLFDGKVFHANALERYSARMGKIGSAR